MDILACNLFLAWFPRVFLTQTISDCDPGRAEISRDPFQGLERKLARASRGVHAFDQLTVKTWEVAALGVCAMEHSYNGATVEYPAVLCDIMFTGEACPQHVARWQNIEYI